MRQQLGSGLIAWWLGSVLVVCAVFFGDQFITPMAADGSPTGSRPATLIDCFARWDGQSYVDILSHGYRGSRHRDLQIAFFPVVPLLGKAICALTGASAIWALVGIASGASLASITILAGGREPGGDGKWVALACACWPPGLFMHMAYTESVFLLLATSAIEGIRRRWHPWVVGSIVGIATGTRSVGVALLVPLAVYTWTYYGRTPRAVGRVVIGCVIGLGGLIAFSSFQAFAYRNPLAFVHIQDSYRMRPQLSSGQRALKLITLEPVWAAYQPTSDGYWAGLPMADVNTDATFSLYFWNPIYFVAAVGLVVLGGAKRWLDRYELTLAAGLLLIPYVTRAYDFGMCSQARFTVVCFPIYLVLGRLLAALPDAWRVSLVALAGLQMCAWSALFAAGYPIF